MSEVNYIINEQLPLNQDFKSLKRQGLAYIQEFSGNEWTNLNPSDPGVTILDQLCYALTELGYCNDFPVKDILAGQDGKIRMKDQFYLPEEILTTSPVTITDYRKYIIDGVVAVKNAIITVSPNQLNRVYAILLYIDPAITDQQEIKNICLAAYYFLNKRRNIGEMFLEPTPLQPVPHLINGYIDIENEKELDQLLLNIGQAIRNYIFPEISQSNYEVTVEDNKGTSDMYNGPVLQNGPITTSSLGEKRDRIRSTEIAHLIGSLPGINAASVPGFDTGKPLTKKITSESNQLLTIDLIQSIQKGLFEIQYKGRTLPAGSVTNLAPPVVQVQAGNPIDIEPKLTKGKFRDIESYYSIQNTFPEIFAVGADAIFSNASNFQIAQSRQLKAYLTLFDQVLANQFSQLANIDHLFSFRNSLTGAPVAEEAFYAKKDTYQRKHLEYPVPYETFSPTYFYQPLYDVPHIKPLLKDHDTFKFSMKLESRKELEHKSWTGYKQDPYNPYIRGVMEFMGEESVSLNRRNTILDHLLARHGESPLIIDSILEGSPYSGDKLKDRVIFKSLYLQNLGLLSYFRQKGCNFLGNYKLSADYPETPADFEKWVFHSDSKDFVFRSGKIDSIERLVEQDFINYSSLELKLGLLFGLRILYQDYLADNYSPNGMDENGKMALWMIQNRKGLILLETSLLLPYTKFRIVLKTAHAWGRYWRVREDLDAKQALALDQLFRNNPPANLEDQINKGVLTIGNTNYNLQLQEVYSPEKKWFKPITGTNYCYAAEIKFGGPIDSIEDNPLFKNRVDMIFPDFIPQLMTEPFKNRLDLFLQFNTPVHVPYKCHFADSSQFKNLIPAFVNWNNSRVPGDTDSQEPINLTVVAGMLATLITQINSSAS